MASNKAKKNASNRKTAVPGPLCHIVASAEARRRVSPAGAGPLVAWVVERFQAGRPGPGYDAAGVATAGGVEVLFLVDESPRGDLLSVVLLTIDEAESLIAAHRGGRAGERN